jgi:hypothetical protein
MAVVLRGGSMAVAKEVVRVLTTRIASASDRRSSVRVSDHRGEKECPKKSKVGKIELVQLKTEENVTIG